MKKIVLSIALFCGMTVADAQVMKILKIDGTTIEYNVSEIKNVSFVESTTKNEENGSSVEGQVTVKDGDGVEHTYTLTVGGTTANYVDLGLPSGTLWATHNIGASKEYEYGTYFAWGEVGAAEEGYVNGLKIDKNKGNSLYGYTYYKWSNYRLSNGNNYTLTKYVRDSKYGTVDNKHILEQCDDAAYVNWGSDWCMPTQAQMVELHDNTYTSWTWYEKGNTEFNGIAGMKVQSIIDGYTDKYIFLPAAGYNGYVGNYTMLWASTLMTTTGACRMEFQSDSHSALGSTDRSNGHTIRPVRVEKAAR